MALTGCLHDLEDIDGIFYNGDHRKVHCAANLDDRSRNSEASIDTALDRARDDNLVVELYSHEPGVTVPLDKLEHVISGAVDRGLPWVTYRELADGGGIGPGIALSFDDAFVDEWLSIRPMLMQYSVRATFFISRYDHLHDEERAGVEQLAADGHDIAAHSVLHLNAPEYVEDNGLEAYMNDEALPSIDVLREAGHDITSYAYPFGARTGELDDALLEHVGIVRSVAFAYYGTVQSPCPN